MECRSDVPAPDVAIDVDKVAGVALAKLLQLVGKPVTSVMYKKQEVWKMFEVADDYAKP